MMLAQILLAAIPLVGVTGEKLRARAFFDANNVRRGDLLILSVDFLGTADFKALHPPALASSVGAGDWHVDDLSAKTQTETRQVGGFFNQQEIDVARRITYRVTPRREGVLWFPALEFEFRSPSGERRLVRSNEIPVHVRPGEGAPPPELPELVAMPSPTEGLVTDPGVALSPDDAFEWRRTCANTNLVADAFVPFDFPAARLNEAWCAIHAGDWRRAMRIYSRLEWRTGQTPEIERGIVAALALRYENPAAELPVWRQVGRPVLRHGWRGRIAWVGGSLAALVLVFGLLGRLIRALACVGLVLLFALPAWADDPFAEMQRMMREHRQQMQQVMSGSFGGGNFSISFGGGETKVPEVTARLALSNPTPRVGERFDFIVSLDVPKSCTATPQNFTASKAFGLVFVTGRGERLADVPSANTNNVIQRIAIPARYDVPFRGTVGFSVGGMITGQQKGGGSRGGFSFSFSNSFETKTPEVAIEVKPLENQPPDFSGIVASTLRFEEKPDALRVGTNDVIVINYRMSLNGYLPEDYLPEGAAFELGRAAEHKGAVTAEWQRYFVADGASATPVAKVVYYDPEAKTFKTATAGGAKITYE